MMLKKFIKSLSVGTLVALSISSQSFASAWDDYKAKYLQQDGAIVDTGNNNMSHSEGQGYGLMFALAYADVMALILSLIKTMLQMVTYLLLGL